MKAMKPKTVFLCLVMMGCMLTTTGYADTLQEAIDEALIVPLATLEADAAYDYFLSTKMETALDNYEAAEDEMEDAFDEFLDVSIPWDKAVEVEVDAAADKFEAAQNKRDAARDKYEMTKANADATYTIAKTKAKAKARQGKQRARHCRTTLKPVDDHVDIVDIVCP